MKKSNKTSILLIYTGGTIGMVKDAYTGTLRAFDFNQLLERIPELYLLDCDIATHSFTKPIDSSDMHPNHWVKMVDVIEENYHHYDGFVILHGSDTMSYSASALSFMLQNLKKPVIFTGSQLPIGDLRTDAKENLITAVQIAALKDKKGAVIQEVGLYFEYKLYRGNRTTKISAEHFNAFASPNFPNLAESGVHLKVNESLLYTSPTEKELTVYRNMNTDIAVLKIFPGLTENILEAILNAKNLKGLVLETFGSGNAPTQDWFVNLLAKAISQGLKVVNVTQCSGGSVNMQKYETGSSLYKIGVVSGKDITTESALAKLMFLINNPKSENFTSDFENPICGEMEQ